MRLNSSTLTELNTLLLDSSNNMIQDAVENLGNGDDCTRLHGALSRTISYPTPHTQQDSSNVTSLVTSLIENLGNMNLHRKLERTQSEPLPQQVNTSRYKTELCRPFEEAGECKYGEKCQFAHGFHELRNLQRHPKYKTEYCRTFHSVGFCPYGPRCHFVHNADEARAMQQLQQQQQQQVSTKLQQQQQKHSTTFNSSSNKTNNNAYTLAPTPKQLAAAGGVQLINHSLPLSPPLSMSTGSDRESPTGSLSLSPTNSMTNFPFAEQAASPINSVFQTSFSYMNSTPPDSPNAPISPISTPPPSAALVCPQQQQSLAYIKPISKSLQIAINKQILEETSNSPTNTNVSSVSAAITANNNPSNMMDTSSVEIETRLPVFNRFSSATEFFPSNVAT